MFLKCGKFKLSLTRPLIMGVLNVTPDSFSDGGKYIELNQILTRANALTAEGADVIDIGGESTRPGAAPVSLEEERRRVLPALERLAGGGVPVSIDTHKPALMREAIASGASMINDVSGFRDAGAFEAVADSGVAICIMHMQGEPRTMQQNPHYDNIISDVSGYLADRVHAAEAAGIARERIVIDPGFGFGKTLEHNLTLLRELRTFRALGCAVLAGLSHKTMLGKITGRDPAERVYASVSAAMIAVQNGAQMVRVHDVAATRDALAVLAAVGRIEN
ncbi:MAG TPA: dihydropteroate synthase [Burkholderiales bacterium]|nr:dihydropteroate synthase [Burkholderiales bacterium]